MIDGGENYNINNQKINNTTHANTVKKDPKGLLHSHTKHIDVINISQRKQGIAM